MPAFSSTGESLLSAEVEGKAEDEDHNPPPGVMIDAWAWWIVIFAVALAVDMIGALVVRNAKKKAARMAQGYVNCPRCGAEVPPQAHNCPKCSAHIRRPR